MLIAGFQGIAVGIVAHCGEDHVSGQTVFVGRDANGVHIALGVRPAFGAAEGSVEADVTEEVMKKMV